MTSWKTPREPKTKAELREMLAEAVRNTQPQPEIKKACSQGQEGLIVIKPGPVKGPDFYLAR